jgi:PAS domain S-box-containing protein
MMGGADEDGGSQAADQRFDLVVAGVKDYAIFMLDPTGRVATWNDGAASIKGYRAEEVIGRDFAIFYTPEDIAVDRPRVLLAEALSEGRAEDVGWRVRKDGTRFWADVVITPIRDAHGLRGFVKLTRDLTRERDADERLRKSEASLRATLYSIGDGVLAADEDARVTRINPVAERLTGWAERDAVGRRLDEVFHIINEETREPAPNPVSRVLAEGVVVGLANHTSLISRDGIERPIADSGAPIVDDAGRTRGAVVVFRDVTSERQAEEAIRRAQEKLRESEESLRATLYSIGDGVIATDADGGVTRLNPVAERLTGWSQGEAIGRPITEVFNIINELTRATAINPVARVLAEGIVVGLANHTALLARDGTERPIADSGAPIVDAAGRTCGAVLVFRDVTDERLAEEALRRSEEKLRQMIASVTDYAFFMLDAAGRVASWNPGAEKIKGYRQDEILGQHFSRFFTPEDIAGGKPARELEIAAAEGRFEDESWRVRKDGTRFWANVVVAPIRDAAGALEGFVKITRDLTERRRTEEERLRLAQAQEAVRLRDEFLSIASHELKTPLTALQLQLRSVLGREPLDDTIRTKVERATRVADRLGQLIDALLDVSRIATGKLKLTFETFDLFAVVKEVAERFREAADDAGCALSLDDGGPISGCWDRLRIEQVLMNLLANAIKYAPGRPIHISAVRAGELAILEVRDHGPGIPETELSRVFDRFERAASPRSFGGLGLGLYVAREIVASHGGTIGAANALGGGTSMTIRLPLDARAAPRA